MDAVRTALAEEVKKAHALLDVLVRQAEGLDDAGRVAALLFVREVSILIETEWQAPVEADEPVTTPAG